MKMLEAYQCRLPLVPAQGHPSLVGSPGELLLLPSLPQLWCRAVGAGLQGCCAWGLGCAWGPDMTPLHRTVAGHTWTLQVVLHGLSKVGWPQEVPFPFAATPFGSR